MLVENECNKIAWWRPDVAFLKFNFLAISKNNEFTLFSTKNVSYIKLQEWKWNDRGTN